MKTKQYKGIELLKKETAEEKIIRLENELKLERHGRNNDINFADAEYKKLALFTLELCDNNYCQSDYSVGIEGCKYFNEDKNICMLKQFCGLD